MKIPYQKFTFTIKAIDELHLPPYKGSTFRGGFGNIFRRVVCPLRLNDCKDCILKQSCIYAYIFETEPNGDAKIMNMSRYEKIPHPFIIEPPEEKTTHYKEGDKLTFNLLLLGRATEYLPYFIFTFYEMGRTGIGKFNEDGHRGRFQLLTVTSNSRIVFNYKTESIIPVKPQLLEIPEQISFSDNQEETITLLFHTPLRISYQRDLVVVPEFHMLMRALLRRLSLLYYFHCEKTPPKFDAKTIIQKAESIKISKNSLRWWGWERYSSRQNTRMRLGGVLGEITYAGCLSPFVQFLKAGEIFHIGKATSFGLGRYTIKETLSQY